MKELQEKIKKILSESGVEILPDMIAPAVYSPSITCAGMECMLAKSVRVKRDEINHNDFGLWVYFYDIGRFAMYQVVDDPDPEYIKMRCYYD